MPRYLIIPGCLVALSLLACNNRPAVERGPDPAKLAPVLARAKAFYQKGQTLLQDGKHAAALQPLRRAIRLRHPGHQVHADVGRALLATGQHHEARGAFHMALSQKPGDAELLVLLGRAQLKSRFPGRAVDSLEKALKKKPGDAEIKRLLGEARTAKK